MKVSSNSANFEAGLCCEEDNGSFSLKPGDANHAKDTLHFLFSPVVSKNVASIFNVRIVKFIDSYLRLQC